MTYVVTSNCQDCRFTDCVTVCPVDCFHGDDRMLYIDPDECIDCGACVPECPVEAIFAEDDVPESEQEWTAINAEKAPGLPVFNEKLDPLPGAEEKKKALGLG
jgi:ferredoxin